VRGNLCDIMSRGGIILTHLFSCQRASCSQPPPEVST